MAYVITHTDGTTYATLGEGELNNTSNDATGKSGVSFLGQNFHNYGSFIANNFLHLLENQASATPPLNPIEGQLWWNTQTQVLSFFDGNRFKPCTSNEVNDAPPLKPLSGDQWWDTSAGQLKVFTGTDWEVIGPSYSKDQLFSGLLPESVSDNTGHHHIISTLQINGNTVAIINNDPQFTLSVPITGISVVGKGITMAPNTIVTGTSLNSQKLGDIAASEYVVKTAASNTLLGSLLVQGIGGLVVNNLTINRDISNNMWLSNPSGNTTILSGSAGLTVDAIHNTITVSQEPTIGSSVTTKLYVDTTVENVNNATMLYVDSRLNETLGSSPIDTLAALSAAINNDPHYGANNTAALNLKADKFNPIFTGVPQAPTAAVHDNSTQLATTQYVQAALLNPGISQISTLNGLTISAALVPSVDNQIDIGTPFLRFRNMYGTAMKANYADLAEIYVPDTLYEAGTVVVFGGREEITVSSNYCDTRIAGVISENPAYLMNFIQKGSPVALTGKVPCKVYGPVKKGDVLVNSHFSGVAIKLGNGDWQPGSVIGKSLEDNNDAGIRNVMVSVGRF